MDAKGTAFATDSLSPIIDRVDINGKASIYINTTVFSALNGIVAHPDCYLVLGSYRQSLKKLSTEHPTYKLAKLPIDVRFDAIFSMMLLPNGNLAFLVFPRGFVYRVQSRDDWTSGTLIAKSPGHSLKWATAITYRDGSIYAIYSHLELAERIGDREVFEIVRVDF